MISRAMRRRFTLPARIFFPCLASLAFASLAPALVACTPADSVPVPCPTGTGRYEGRCVDPTARYEPDERIDENNVVAYGDPLTNLDLPDPPKSGFRIVAPPRTMEAGQEVETCIAWPFPAIQNKLVYSARVYATEGLHHSNVISKPIDPDSGPNPYPQCNP